MSESMPEMPDGPLEDPDMPRRTQDDVPDGVEHGSEEDPDQR
jgi:hypothetical protein